jgi:hypothetical protein
VDSPSVNGAPRDERPAMLAVKRVAIAGATAFLAINLWTGAPLLALWVGSRVVGQTTLSMRAVMVVVLVLAVLVFSMAIALAWLNGAYCRLTGQPPGESRLAWLRSYNEPEPEQDPELIGVRSSVLERIVVMSVFLAVVCLLVWFFFFAGSPLPT